jgi:hypothetical protein
MKDVFLSSVATSLLHLPHDRIEGDDVRRGFYDIPDKLVLETQPVEEVRRRKDGILHRAKGGIPGEQSFQVLASDITDDQEIDPILLSDERSRKNDKSDAIQPLHFGNERFLSLHRLPEEIPQIRKEGEIMIDSEIFLPCTGSGLHEANALEILQLTADGIDLLIENPRELADEVLLVGMSQEEREELHSRRRAEECLENVIHRGGREGRKLMFTNRIQE